MSPLIGYQLLPHVPRSAGAAEERGVDLEFCAFPTRGNGHFRGAAGSALTAADRGTCLGVLVEGDRVWVAERRTDRHAVGLCVMVNSNGSACPAIGFAAATCPTGSAASAPAHSSR